MRARYCSRCGNALQPTSNSCDKCSAAAEPNVRCLMSIRRVILMSALSGGIYLFWWFYITWKHYRDYTGEKAYPVWHALTLMVPIYSLFRVHAHIRVYTELMSNQRLDNSVSPLKAVIAIFISTALANVGRRQAWFGEITEGLAIAMLIGLIVSTIIVVWLLASVQANLNGYWQTVMFRQSPSHARIGIGEALLLILGLYNWYDAVMLVFSASYRTG